MDEQENPKLFGMIQAEEIDSLPILPRELERVIFETAAENRLMAVRLLLVAKRVKQWIQPLLYRVVVKSERYRPPKGLPSHSVPRPSYGPFVQHLLIGKSIEQLEALIFLSECRHVENLALWSPNVDSRCLRWLTNMPLKRLSADIDKIFASHQDPVTEGASDSDFHRGQWAATAESDGINSSGGRNRLSLNPIPFGLEQHVPASPSQTHFPHLTHLEIMNPCKTWSKWSRVLTPENFPYLSRLALDFYFSLDFVQGALMNLPNLKLLMLVYDLDSVSDGNLVEVLTGVRDFRVVPQCANMGTGRQEGKWEQAVKGTAMDMWDVAEMIAMHSLSAGCHR